MTIHCCQMRAPAVRYCETELPLSELWKIQNRDSVKKAPGVSKSYETAGQGSRTVRRSPAVSNCGTEVIVKEHEVDASFKPVSLSSALEYCR